MKIFKNPTDKNFLILVQNFCQLGFLKFSFLWEKDFFRRKICFFSQILIFFIFDEISINTSVITSEYPSYLEMICIRNSKNIISPSYYLYFFLHNLFNMSNALKMQKNSLFCQMKVFVFSISEAFIYIVSNHTKHL